jgi:hypothetical protein
VFPGIGIVIIVILSHRYVDEMDEFKKDPVAWLKTEYPPKRPCTLPTHIVKFDSLNITNYLFINNYTLRGTYFQEYHLHLLPELKESFLQIYHRKPTPCPPH